LVTSDSFVSVRQLLRPAYRRREPVFAAGRWSLFRSVATEERTITPALVERIARQLLLRYGVVFRAVLERERIPVPWRELVRTYRLLELRGEIRGGRFVAGFAGEQYALPEAIPKMRRLKKHESPPKGILPPGERVPSTSTGMVAVV